MTAKRIFWGAAAFAAAVSPVAAAARPTSGPNCELHVWGVGYPNRPVVPPKKSIFAKVVTQVPQDPNDPLSFNNLYGSGKRAAALSDDILRKLMPDAASVTIVKHDDLVDIDRYAVDKINLPLGTPKVSCYADLVIANLYAVMTSDLRQRLAVNLLQGLAVNLLVGGDRLVIDFWFRRYPGPKGRPFTVHRKNDSPLPHVGLQSPEIREALVTSSNTNLAAFADYVASKRIS